MKTNIREHYFYSHQSNPQFGNYLPELDPTRILNYQQTTLRQAKALQGSYLEESIYDSNSHYLYKSNYTDKELKFQNKLFKDYFKNPFMYIGTLIGAATALAFGFAVQDKVQTQTEITSQLKTSSSKMTASDIENAKYTIADCEAKIFISTMVSLVVGAMGTLYHGSTIVNARKAYLDFKKAKKELGDYEKNVLKAAPSSDEASYRVTKCIENSIYQSAQQIANRIYSLYHADPDAKDHFNALYGSKENLPNSTTIRELFKYYAYQAIQANSAKHNPNGITKITQLDFLKETYALLLTATQLGDMFQFVKEDPKGPLGQSFEETLSWQAEKVRLQVESRCEKLKDLLTQEIELDRHIKLAQSAWVTAKLAQGEKQHKADELKTLLTQLKTQKEKIKAALTQDDEALFKNDTLLTSLNDEFLSLESYLKVVLQENELNQEVEESIKLAKQTKHNQPEFQLPSKLISNQAST